MSILNKKVPFQEMTDQEIANYHMAFCAVRLVDGENLSVAWKMIENLLAHVEFLKMDNEAIENEIWELQSSIEEWRWHAADLEEQLFDLQSKEHADNV